MIQCDQGLGAVIPTIQSSFNLQKAIHVLHPITKIKDSGSDHMITSINAEKAMTKFKMCS